MFKPQVRVFLFLLIALFAFAFPVSAQGATIIDPCASPALPQVITVPAFDLNLYPHPNQYWTPRSVGEEIRISPGCYDFTNQDNVSTFYEVVAVSQPTDNFQSYRDFHGYVLREDLEALGVIISRPDNATVGGDSGPGDSEEATCLPEDTIQDAAVVAVTQGHCNSFFTFLNPEMPSDKTLFLWPGEFAHGWHAGVVTEWVNTGTQPRQIAVGTVDAVRVFSADSGNGEPFDLNGELAKLVDHLNATYTGFTWTPVLGQ